MTGRPKEFPFVYLHTDRDAGGLYVRSFGTYWMNPLLRSREEESAWGDMNRGEGSCSQRQEFVLARCVLGRLESVGLIRPRGNLQSFHFLSWNKCLFGWNPLLLKVVVHMVL